MIAAIETNLILKEILEELKQLRKQLEDMSHMQVELVATAHSIQVYGTKQHR